MRSRTLQAHVLGLVALALTAMAAGEARADPAARDKWVSDDGSIAFEVQKGQDAEVQKWSVTWTVTANTTAGLPLDVIKTRGRGGVRVLERTGAIEFTVILGTKEAVIFRDSEAALGGPPPGKIKGTWK